MPSPQMKRRALFGAWLFLLAIAIALPIATFVIVATNDPVCTNAQVSGTWVNTSAYDDVFLQPVVFDQIVRTTPVTATDGTAGIGATGVTAYGTVTPTQCAYVRYNTSAPQFFGSLAGLSPLAWDSWRRSSDAIVSSFITTPNAATYQSGLIPSTVATTTAGTAVYPRIGQASGVCTDVLGTGTVAATLSTCIATLLGGTTAVTGGAGTVGAVGYPQVAASATYLSTFTTTCATACATYASTAASNCQYKCVNGLLGAAANFSATTSCYGSVSAGSYCFMPVPSTTPGALQHPTASGYWFAPVPSPVLGQLLSGLSANLVQLVAGTSAYVYVVPCGLGSNPNPLVAPSIDVTVAVPLDSLVSNISPRVYLYVLAGACQFGFFVVFVLMLFLWRAKKPHGFVRVATAALFWLLFLFSWAWLIIGVIIYWGQCDVAPSSVQRMFLADLIISLIGFSWLALVFATVGARFIVEERKTIYGKEKSAPEAGVKKATVAAAAPASGGQSSRATVPAGAAQAFRQR